MEDCSTSSSKLASVNCNDIIVGIANKVFVQQVREDDSLLVRFLIFSCYWDSERISECANSSAVRDLIYIVL